MLHHPFPLSLPPAVFLFITITNISHLSAPPPPLSLTSLPPSPVPLLFHLCVPPSLPSLTPSPDGCRGEARLTLNIILAPVALRRKPPHLSAGGGAVQVAVWFPPRPHAICHHPSNLPQPPLASDRHEPGDSRHSWNTEVMMGRRPAAAFRAHRRGRTYRFPTE